MARMDVSLNRVKNMTVGSPLKLLIFFSAPLIAANFGQQLYMIVDAIIVGRGVGVEALASVGATDWSYWLALWVVQALTQGFAIPISQYFGEGNHTRLRQTVAMSIKLCILIGIVLTVICLLIARPLLRLLQTPENIFAGALEYLLTMYGGILIVMAYNMAASILRALGDGKTPLIAISIAAVTNIILDLLFVLVFQWGIIGAAVATVTAQLFAFLYCFRVLKNLELMKIKKEDWNFRRDIVSRQCSLGAPLALQHILISVGGMILQSAINKHGFLFIAGFTATNKIYGLLESSAISLGYAVTTYMAQNYGGGFYSRIRKGLKTAVLIAVLLSVLVSITMIFAGKPILSLFIDNASTNASETLEIAYHYLYIMSCLLLSLYFLYVFRNTLQGLGNAIAPLLSGIMEFFARVSVAYVFTRIWGDEWIFFAEPSAWIAAMVILILICLRSVHRLPLSDSGQTDL